jgi:hypothetical protein
MKKQISYIITALLAATAISAAATPDKDAMMAKEKAAWQAFKDKNADGFKKVVHAEFRGVYDTGIVDVQKELDDMKKWDMKSFTISDYKIVAVGADTVMSTYTVVVEGTYDGKDASGTFNAGSVWKLAKGGWMAIFHTNIKAEAAPSPATSP